MYWKPQSIEPTGYESTAPKYASRTGGTRTTRQTRRLTTGLLTHNISQTVLWNKYDSSSGGSRTGCWTSWLLPSSCGWLIQIALGAQTNTHSHPLTKLFLPTWEPNWLLAEQQQIITHKTLPYLVHYSQTWTNMERMTKLVTHWLFTKCCQNCISSWTDRLSHQKQSMAHMHTPACNLAKRPPPPLHRPNYVPNAKATMPTLQW